MKNDINNLLSNDILFSNLCTCDKMYTATQIKEIVEELLKSQNKMKKDIFEKIIKKAEIEREPSVKTINIKYENQTPYLNICYDAGKYLYGPNDTGVKLESIKINNTTKNVNNILTGFNIIDISDLVEKINISNIPPISLIEYSYSDGEPAFNNVESICDSNIKIESDIISSNISSLWINVFNNNTEIDFSKVSSISDLESYKLKILLFENEKPIIFKPETEKVQKMIILVPSNSSVKVFDLEDDWEYVMKHKKIENETVSLYYFDLPTAMVNKNNYKIIVK